MLQKERADVAANSVGSNKKLAEICGSSSFGELYRE